MSRDYGKLVRDRVPEMIEENNEEPITKVLNNEEFLKELNNKLEEEVNEYLESKNFEELADILEVILTISQQRHDKTISDLNTERKRKNLEKGGFNDRIYLEDVNS